MIKKYINKQNNFFNTMDYYEKRKQAMVLINAMLQEGKPIEAIYYKVSMSYGYSKRFVDNFVELKKNLDQ